MKRSALALGCLLAAAHASAGWSMLQENREGILYIDRDSAEKTASGWVAEVSQDFHKVQRHGTHEYLSARSRHELDCQAKSLRRLRVELFPENMAGGGTLHADDQPQAWHKPEPGSADEAIWKGLCP